MAATKLLSDNGVTSGITGYQLTGGNDGTLQLQTTTAGGTATTAMTIGTDQSTTLAGTLNLAGQNMTPYTGFKNRIINGAMVIDQRNAGSSVNPSDGAYTLDRWSAGVSLTSKLTIQQSTTAPAGFSSSLLITSSSAYSVTSSDYFGVVQRIEGFNTVDLAFGTASASTVTLSFWVRSSLTGTFSGSLRNSAQNRSYVFTYAINAANTWEQKTITIAGDTSGTWIGATNGAGLQVWFSVGAGSTYNGTAGSWVAANHIAATGATSVVGTNGATFYITGVQLEKGSTATSFDYRPYGTELQLCQRYYYKLNGYMLGYTTSVSFAPALVVFPVTMRSAPAIDAGGSFAAQAGSSGTFGYTIITNQNAHLYNSAGNWTTNVWVTATAGFNAEL